MLVQVGGSAAGRQVVLTYVTEAPAWKPSYRVIMGKQGRVDLEGWAIVDNTSGEDWRSVRVGVGSSSALSFRFDLHSLRVVQRETLQSQERFRHGAPARRQLVAEGPRQELVLDQLADREIPRQAGHPELAAKVASGSLRGKAGRDEMVALGDKSDWGRGSGHAGLRGRGGERMANHTARPARVMAKRPATDAPPAADDSRVRALAQSLRGRRGTILLEGYAGANENEPATRALDRANLLRNQLILNGVAPARSRWRRAGSSPGSRPACASSSNPRRPSSSRPGPRATRTRTAHRWARATSSPARR